MADKQKNNLNEDQILAYLREAVDKIRTEEDPLELNLYRRLFRKAVPLTLRAYFTAYLLKEINTGKIPSRLGPQARTDRSGGKQGRQGRNEGRQGREGGRNERQEEPRRGKGESRQAEAPKGEGRARERREGEGKAEPRNVLPDDVATTLFVSIGRNRRVYPRDLIGLIMQNAEIDRDHIGDIRVLDNYSFVQIVTEDAEKVIAALNEFEYRGRKLAVSFSRKRDGEASGESVADTASSADNDDSISGDVARDEGSADSFMDSGSSDEPLEDAPDAGSWQDESELDDGEEKKTDI